MLTHDDVANMSLTERLERLATAADTLAATITGHGEPVIARRPDAKNWAPKEVVCHLRDAEELFMGRFQTIMAMDAP